METPKAVPKELIQTSPKQLPRYVIEMNMRYCAGWEYKHFGDKDIYEFFEQNPLDEFRDIKEKFDSFSHGAHRADLFRYFYLYQKGGVYLDCDAILETKIENLIDSYEFVSINSYHLDKTLLFNGFLVARPGCQIMYDALKDAYETDDSALINDYYLFCKNLFVIVEKHSDKNIKIYQEEKTKDYYAGVRTYNDERELLLTHYCYLREIPTFKNRLVSALYPVIFKYKFLFKLYRIKQKL